MRYFIDTEFIEYAPTSEHKGTIDLISIGIVSEEGDTLYCISSEFDASKASDWVVENVINKLETDQPRFTIEEIKNKIDDFIDDSDPTFYAYFCNYDWVAFCWIFGCMVDLPDAYPMYCRDIKYLMSMFGISKEDLPIQEDGHHNALEDAKWNLKAFKSIQKFDKLISTGSSTL